MQDTLARHLFDQLRLSSATDDLLAVRAGKLATTRALARSAREVIDAKKCVVEVCDRLLRLRLRPEQRTDVNERRTAARSDLLAAARSLAAATIEIAKHDRQERNERGRLTLRVRVPGFVLHMRMPRCRTARQVRVRRCTARVSRRAKHVARTTRATAGPDGDSDPERPSGWSSGSGHVGLGRAGLGHRVAGLGHDRLVARVVEFEARDAVGAARMETLTAGVRPEVSP